MMATWPSEAIWGVEESAMLRLTGIFSGIPQPGFLEWRG
jgi:hypothetical protein